MRRYQAPHFLIALCLMVGGWLPAASAQPSSFPTRPITLVVPFSAGSSADILGRRLGEGLKRELNATVIVEDAPGAGGMLGAVKVKNAEPDGYTLFIGTQGIFVINQLIQKKMSYSRDDFVPLVNLINFPNILVVPLSLGVKSVSDLVELAKKRAANGKPLTYGHGGSGTSSHLAAELFKLTTGVEMTAVPYKSVADTAPDLLGGRLDVVFGNIGIFEPHVKDGRVAALAVTSANRSGLLPDVPTIGQAGYPKAEVTVWLGLFARKGTPQPILDAIEKAAVHTFADQKIHKQYELEGVEVTGTGEKEFRSYIDQDAEKWGAIVPKLGIDSN